MSLDSKHYETKDEKSGARGISLTPRQEELYFWLRGKIDLDDSAAFTVRRLFSRMRIDTAACCALSRLVGRALRDAENEDAYIVAGMKRLAVEHKADGTDNSENPT